MGQLDQLSSQIQPELVLHCTVLKLEKFLVDLVSWLVWLDSLFRRKILLLKR